VCPLGIPQGASSFNQDLLSFMGFVQSHKQEPITCYDCRDMVQCNAIKTLAQVGRLTSHFDMRVTRSIKPPHSMRIFVHHGAHVFQAVLPLWISCFLKPAALWLVIQTSLPIHQVPFVIIGSKY